MDNKEYYRHRNASPLSEIKVADTRKPTTRATDGTGRDRNRSSTKWKICNWVEAGAA
ncbi:hypothetical protein CRYUN_Cryun01aG0192300 [Craigia yunnanensis]